MRGAILNMTSILAFHPSPAHFPTHAYAAAKGAIVSLTTTMAAYYAPQRIRVNARRPVADADADGGPRGVGPATVAFAALEAAARRRPARARGRRDAAAFLLSGEARAITGQVAQGRRRVLRDRIAARAEGA